MDEPPSPNHHHAIGDASVTHPGQSILCNDRVITAELTSGGPRMLSSVSPAGSEHGIWLGITTDFALLIGERNVGVPRGVQRLLAFLAIARTPVHRSRVAGQLWPD